MTISYRLQQVMYVMYTHVLHLFHNTLNTLNTCFLTLSSLPLNQLLQMRLSWSQTHVAELQRFHIWNPCTGPKRPKDTCNNCFLPPIGSIVHKTIKGSVKRLACHTGSLMNKWISVLSGKVSRVIDSTRLCYERRIFDSSLELQFQM